MIYKKNFDKKDNKHMVFLKVTLKIFNISLENIPINISKETRFIAMKITILLYNI